MQRVVCAVHDAAQHAAMISIEAVRLHSPFGDMAQTFAAIAAGERAQNTLKGPLLDQINDLLSDGPWEPDLILFASTKGDGPLWMEDCLHEGEGEGIGGPGWIAAQLGKELGCAAMAVSVACASGLGRWQLPALPLNMAGINELLLSALIA